MRRMALLFLLISLSILYSHGDEEQLQSIWNRIGIYDPINILYICSTISGIAIALAIVTKDKIDENLKKIIFAVIAIPIIIATVYLGGTTVYLNMISASEGPVHWHADYEVWVCGIKYELIDPTGIDNKVGSATVHEHNENRIHIEGVLLSKSDAELGMYFKAIGGKFKDGELVFPTNDGVKRWGNGDKCNGKEGKLYMFVNGKPNEEFDEYVISPYPDVPPGDRIKFIFTDKELKDINKELGSPP